MSHTHSAQLTHVHNYNTVACGDILARSDGRVVKNEKKKKFPLNLVDVIHEKKGKYVYEKQNSKEILRREWKAQASVPRRRQRRRRRRRRGHRRHSNQITNNWIYSLQFAENTDYDAHFSSRFAFVFHCSMYIQSVLSSFGHERSHEVKRSEEKITHTRVNWSVFELKLIGGKSLRVEKFSSTVAAGHNTNINIEWMERIAFVPFAFNEFDKRLSSFCYRAPSVARNLWPKFYRERHRGREKNDRPFV